MIHSLGRGLHSDVLRLYAEWLMGVPAGLKLNHEASRWLGGGVLWAIDVSEKLTSVLAEWETTILVVLAVLALGGITLALAAAADILELATVHVYALYTQFAWLHTRQVSVLSSLYHLFRGKKHNLLRERIDSHEYSIPQLLLGTLLFAVVFFLFPTIAVFYAFFSTAWLFVLCAQATLWWSLAILNEFPFYGLFCRFAHPEWLPAGVHLEMTATTPASQSSPAPSSPENRLFILRRHVASIGILFQSYSSSLGHLMRHYAVGKIVGAFFFGEYIPAAPDVPNAPWSSGHVLRPNVARFREDALAVWSA